MWEPGCFFVGGQDVPVAECLLALSVGLEAESGDFRGFGLACDKSWKKEGVAKSNGISSKPFKNGR